MIKSLEGMALSHDDMMTVLSTMAYFSGRKMTIQPFSASSSSASSNGRFIIDKAGARATVTNGELKKISLVTLDSVVDRHT